MFGCGAWAYGGAGLPGGVRLVVDLVVQGDQFVEEALSAFLVERDGE